MKPSDSPDIVALAKALNDQGARWVLLGGMAVILHGGYHVTQDADIAFQRAKENLDAVKRALESVGARPLRAGDEGKFELDYSILMAPFMHLKSDAGNVDLINRLPGIDSFEGLYERADVVDVQGVPIRVASIDDLIALKSASNRPKDAEHVAELKSLKGLATDAP